MIAIVTIIESVVIIIITITMFNKDVSSRDTMIAVTDTPMSTDSMPTAINTEKNQSNTNNHSTKLANIILTSVDMLMRYLVLSAPFHL